MAGQPLPSTTHEPPRESKPSLLAPAVLVRAMTAIEVINTELDLSNAKVGIYETLRTPARQTWLYAQGRTRAGDIVTNAPTVDTTHHGYGTGFDFVFRDHNNQWFWPPASDHRWARCHEVFLDHGLARGPSWDGPHIQAKGLSVSPDRHMRELFATFGQRKLSRIWEEYDLITVHYYDTRLPW